MPAGVPAATSTEVPFKVTPVFVELTKVVVTLVGSTNTPFRRSLPNTLDTAVPPVKPLAEPASAIASITGAVTVTVTSA